MIRLNPLSVALALSICTTAILAPAALHAQTGSERRDVQVDVAGRRAAVTELIRQIEALYPVPEIGTRTARTLRERLQSGAYDGDSSARSFSERLTRELQEISGDQHFNIAYFVEARPFPEVPPTPAQKAAAVAEAGLANFGFSRVERLAGNVGYVRLDRFHAPEHAGPVAAAAMAFVARTDALIIDLRENGGGRGETLTLLASYFSDGQERAGGIQPGAGVRRAFNALSVAGPRYLDRPVYVLTSARTFSAAEAFAYNLQALGRVTVVGETTRGGANPVARILLSERFGALIPNARSVNPITGKNWGGVGVQPDVRVPADRALDAAHLAAVRSVLPAHPDDALTQELQRVETRLATVASPASM